MARPLSAEARTKALDAAHELLLERGLDGCTVEAVAKRIPEIHAAVGVPVGVGFGIRDAQAAGAIAR